ncbi:MAG: hypothetical protein GTO60_16775 [Gammaproteobacteria bacterium]|nr:hypothetical protein [Gammaproteobacteria bacterium]
MANTLQLLLWTGCFALSLAVFEFEPMEEEPIIISQPLKPSKSYMEIRR